MIRYSPSSARAIGYLKRFYNDIEVYVEDTASPNMHLLICRRILGPRIRLSSVTPLGGKEHVLEACRRDQADATRKRLYVVDGDFDLILGLRKPRLKYLYRLRAYCIENLLLSETAIEAACLQSSPNLQPPQIHALLDLRNWLSNLLAHLRPLFVCYAICRALSPTTQTIATQVYTMCVQGGQGPAPERVKVFRRIRAVLRDCRTACPTDAMRRARSHFQAIMTNDLRDTKYISAKDYILPLLYHRLHSLFGFRGTIEQLKLQLAAQYEPAQEPFYARRLRYEAGL